MPIEPAVIINVIGANTGAAAENETTWHDNYFPSMYDSTWAPGGTVGFFLGHRPIPGNESEAESYLWVNVGEIGSWLIDNTSLSSGNVSFNSATERLKMGAVTDFDVSGTAKGILLGKDVDDYEFFAGDENGNYIHWDGTNLNIVGTLIATTGQIGTWYINDTTLSSNVVENDSGILLDAATPQIRVGPTSDGYISIIGGNTPEIISSNFNPSALIPDGFRFSAIGGIIEATDGIFRGELKTNIFTKNEINIINGDLAITTAEKLDADLSTTSTALTLKSDVFSIGDVIKIGTTQGGGGTSQELMRITGDGGDGTYTIIRDVNNTETTGDEHNKNDIAYKVGYLNSTYGIIEILGSDERILFSRTSHSDGGGGPDVLTINKRVVLGDVGTNQFGIQGYDGGDPSSLVFELGEIQNWIAGWDITTTSLSNISGGDGIALNTNSTNLINQSTGSGFEVYDAGNPKLFIGNSTSYLKWNITASTLDIKGDITADNLTINSDFSLGNEMDVSGSGAIRSGKTSLIDTTTQGYWLDAAGPNFYIGSTSDTYYLKFISGALSWAGTNTSLTAAGVFTATSATITGTIEATAGYFGDATNGWTIQAGGIVAKTSSSLIDLAGGNLWTADYTTSQSIFLDGTDNSLKFYSAANILAVTIDTDIFTFPGGVLYPGIDIPEGIIQLWGGGTKTVTVPSSNLELAPLLIAPTIKVVGDNTKTFIYRGIDSNLTIANSSTSTKVGSGYQAGSFQVTQDHDYGGATGIYGKATISESANAGTATGMYGNSSQKGSGPTYGVRGVTWRDSVGTAYAGHFSAQAVTAAGDAIGVYGSASSSSGNAWSGYFNDGDVYIKDTLNVGIAVVAGDLTVSNDIHLTDALFFGSVDNSSCRIEYVATNIMQFNAATYDLNPGHANQSFILGSDYSTENLINAATGSRTTGTIFFGASRSSGTNDGGMYQFFADRVNRASWQQCPVLSICHEGNDPEAYGLNIAAGRYTDGAGTDQTFVSFFRPDETDGFAANIGSITGDGGTVTYNPFTGVHGAFIVDSDLNILPMTPGNSSDLLARGTVIVLSTSALIVPSGQPYTNQPTHYAMPCSSSYDKRVFGVYFSDCIQREPYVNQGSIAALGDGIILVCDEGGDLEVGDYITTSNTVGHGMKQDDDLLHNYTVAKSLRDVIWADEDTTTLLIPCTYHAG